MCEAEMLRVWSKRAYKKGKGVWCVEEENRVAYAEAGLEGCESELETDAREFQNHNLDNLGSSLAATSLGRSMMAKGGLDTPCLTTLVYSNLYTIFSQVQERVVQR